MSLKVIAKKDLADTVARHRENGLQIVFTNGCFDILHAGHVDYLQKAKSCGDILVIGLNSDHSVRMIKGEKRPIVPQNQRALVLSGLACVDYISFFDEPDPLQLILAIRPDILVKGADWEEKNIIGAAQVKDGGGRVVRVNFISDTSTTQIIDKIVELYGTKN